MTAGERLIQQGLEQGLERGRELGLEQGREQGIKQGSEKNLLNLIRLKFKVSNPETAARVHAASLETIERWIAATLTAETLEELFNS